MEILYRATLGILLGNEQTSHVLNNKGIQCCSVNIYN